MDLKQVVFDEVYRAFNGEPRVFEYLDETEILI